MDKKTCTRCDKEKGIAKFREARGYKGGRTTWCVDCERAWHKENKPKTRQVTITHQICIICNEDLDADKFSKAKTRVTGLDNRCKNCYKLQTRKRRENTKVKERDRKLSLIYHKKNPHIRKKSKANRRAREKNCKGHFTKEQLLARFAYYGNKCIYCHTAKNITLEHLIPLSRGGTNWASNLAPSCLSCNISKSTKTHTEFLQQSKQRP